jgi:hypothetical protein
MAPMLAIQPPMTRSATSMARGLSRGETPWVSPGVWCGLGGASLVREDQIEPRRPFPAPGPRAIPAPRLSERAREAMRLRHFSPRTKEAYLGWMRRYHDFHGRRDPAGLGLEHLSAFLNALATRRFLWTRTWPRVSRMQTYMLLACRSIPHQCWCWPL